MKVVERNSSLFVPGICSLIHCISYNIFQKCEYLLPQDIEMLDFIYHSKKVIVMMIFTFSVQLFIGLAFHCKDSKIFRCQSTEKPRFQYLIKIEKKKNDKFPVKIMMFFVSEELSFCAFDEYFLGTVVSKCLTFFCRLSLSRVSYHRNLSNSAFNDGRIWC